MDALMHVWIIERREAYESYRVVIDVCSSKERAIDVARLAAVHDHHIGHDLINFVGEDCFEVEAEDGYTWIEVNSYPIDSIVVPKRKES